MTTSLHAHASPRALLVALAHLWTRPSTSSPRQRERRHYPPQRDRVIEEAAMAREMYRL